MATTMEVASGLIGLTLAAINDRLGALEADGAVFAEAGGVWSMTHKSMTADSIMGPAGAARAWAEAVLLPPRAGVFLGPDRMAGVVNESIDPFLVNGGR